MKKILMTSLASTVSMFAIVSSVNAATLTPVENVNYQQEVRQEQSTDISSDFSEAIKMAKIFAPYVEKQENGTFKLGDIPENLGLTEDEISDFREGLEIQNKMIENGEISFDKGKVIIEGEAVNGNNFVQPSISTDWSWNSVKVILSESETQEMIGILNMASGGAAALTSWLVKKGHTKLAYLSGFVGAIYTLEAGALSALDARGGNKGIYLKYTWGIGPLMSVGHN